MGLHDVAKIEGSCSIANYFCEKCHFDAYLYLKARITCRGRGEKEVS
jgi:hypothetical protein